VEVGLISSTKFQLNFSELQKQPDGLKGFIVAAQTAQGLLPVRQQSQRDLLNICDDIKVEEVGYYAGNDETFVCDDASRRDEAVSDNSYSLFEFIVNMLCNNAVGCGEEDKETKLCEIRGRLPAQETAVKLQTEAVDIRALGALDLRKKVDESDNRSHEQKGNLFHIVMHRKREND
jgi:hypothetical protein